MMRNNKDERWVIINKWKCLFIQNVTINASEIIITVGKCIIELINITVINYNSKAESIDILLSCGYFVIISQLI